MVDKAFHISQTDDGRVCQDNGMNCERLSAVGVRHCYQLGRVWVKVYSEILRLLMVKIYG